MRFSALSFVRPQVLTVASSMYISKRCNYSE